MTKIEQKIPEGWSVKKLGECFQFLKTTSHSRGETQRSGEVHYIHYGDIHTKYNLHVSPSDIDLFISESQAEKGSLLQNGDLILLDASEDYEGTTKCIELSNICNEKIIAGLHTLALRDKNKNFSDGFRAYITSMPWVKSNFWKQVTGIKVYGISKENLTGILSCWDDGIEKLSALIEKKKIQKKALMQQLLTGKHRLKGFSTPWHEVKLGDIATIAAGTSKAQYIDEKGDCFVVDMGAVSNEATLIAKKRTSYYEDFLNVNDIIMPKDDIGGGNIIGKCIIVLENRKYILGDHVFKLVIKNNFPLFICLKINSFEINKYMKRCATGSAQLGLSKKDVSKCLLYIPSDLAEQKAIAEILSKADEEIELLNKKLEAFKQEKKALMQQLLTGKIRVKVN